MAPLVQIIEYDSRIPMYQYSIRMPPLKYWNKTGNYNNAVCRS